MRRKGLIEGVLTRATDQGYDFLDANGQFWDVKTPQSFSYEGKHIFNLTDVIKSVTKEY